MSEFAVALVTCPVGEADSLAETLVNERLAACVNVIQPIVSHFHWEGRVCREDEALLIIKTRSSYVADLVDRVCELHSYDVPEVIALPIVEGSKDYLKWLESETRRRPDQ